MTSITTIHNNAIWQFVLNSIMDYIVGNIVLVVESVLPAVSDGIMDCDLIEEIWERSLKLMLNLS